VRGEDGEVMAGMAAIGISPSSYLINGNTSAQSAQSRALLSKGNGNFPLGFLNFNSINVSEI
jgi:hypothetical protein